MDANAGNQGKDGEKRKKFKANKHKREHSGGGRPEPAVSSESVTDEAEAATPSSSRKRPADDSNADKSKRHSKPKKAKLADSEWAFEVDYNDHFETPLRAYEDILAVLDSICASTGKTKEQLVIYDPYYCKGRMVSYLQGLGYAQVINENRDFYKDVARKTVPEYDVMVTNPPYSGEHKLKLLEYLRSAGKPSALLLPAYIATKSYWKTYLAAGQSALYVLPPDYYHYSHPEGTGKALPPFYSAWLISGMDKAAIDTAAVGLRKYALTRPLSPLPSAGGVVAKALPIRQLAAVQSVQEMVRLGVITDVSRPNPKQRKKRLQGK